MPCCTSLGTPFPLPGELFPLLCLADVGALSFFKDSQVKPLLASAERVPTPWNPESKRTGVTPGHFLSEIFWNVPAGRGWALSQQGEVCALATSLGPPAPTPSHPTCSTRTHRALLPQHGRTTSFAAPQAAVPWDPRPQAGNPMPTPCLAPGIYSNLCDLAAAGVQCHVQNPTLFP